MAVHTTNRPVRQIVPFAILCVLSIPPAQAGCALVNASVVNTDWESQLSADSAQSIFPMAGSLSGADSGWFAQSKSKVDDMRTLEHGWDGYQADPPSTATIEKARMFLQALYRMNLKPNRIAASAEGGITLAFYSLNKYSDVEILNSGEVLAVTSSSDGNPKVWEVESDEQIKATLGKIRDYIWER